MKILIYTALVMLVGVFSFAAGESTAEMKNEAQIEQMTVKETVKEPVIPDMDENLPDVVERVLPTVVGIEAISRGGMGDGAVSLGSGVIVSDMGYIVTNWHVVGDNPYRIDITLYDGSVQTGKLCWGDRSLDIAVVKYNGNVPAVAVMGEYENVRVGEDVFAIGNPLSLQFERSVTKGIISAINRTITVTDENSTLYMEDLLQTDASINPGNSGGPLMNAKGEVIGINTVRVSTAEGMGFAVPVNICESVIAALEENGKFETPYMGLFAYTSQTAKYLRKENSPIEGLFVMSLDVNGPAYKGGVKYGDIITEINGVEVRSMLKLRRELFKCDIGSEAVLTVVSGKEKNEVRVDVEKMSENYMGANQ